MPIISLPPVESAYDSLLQKCVFLNLDFLNNGEKRREKRPGAGFCFFSCFVYTQQTLKGKVTCIVTLIKIATSPPQTSIMSLRSVIYNVKA